MEAIVEHIEHPFARGNLTSNGVQYSDVLTTSTDDYETVESVTVAPPKIGAALEYEFGLTCALQSSSTTESVLFKWQAKNCTSSTWVDIVPAVTFAANASSLTEYTYSGVVAPQDNLDQAQIDIRLQIKSGSAGGETAKGKTKNSSYVKIKYPTF